MTNYVVMNENTLGYIQPQRSDWFNPLAGSLRKVLDPLSGPVPIGSLDVIRTATQDDFDTYRVSSNGHLT